MMRLIAMAVWTLVYWHVEFNHNSKELPGQVLFDTKGYLAASPGPSAILIIRKALQCLSDGDSGYCAPPMLESIFQHAKAFE